MKYELSLTIVHETRQHKNHYQERVSLIPHRENVMILDVNISHESLLLSYPQLTVHTTIELRPLQISDTNH